MKNYFVKSSLVIFACLGNNLFAATSSNATLALDNNGFISKLTLQEVLFNNTYNTAEFNFIKLNNRDFFELNAFYPTPNPSQDHSTAANFDGKQLDIPSVSYGNIDYRATLQYYGFRENDRTKLLFAIGPVVAQTPQLTFTATNQTVAYNGSTTLTWNANNATSCTSNAWTGTKSASGSVRIDNLTTNQTYTLTCSGAGTTVVANPINVIVQLPPKIELQTSLRCSNRIESIADFKPILDVVYTGNNIYSIKTQNEYTYTDYSGSIGYYTLDGTYDVSGKFSLVMDTFFNATRDNHRTDLYTTTVNSGQSSFDITGQKIVDNTACTLIIHVVIK